MQRIYEAVERHPDDIVAAMPEEYGGTFQFSGEAAKASLTFIKFNIYLLRTFEFQQTIGDSEVFLEVDEREFSLETLMKPANAWKTAPLMEKHYFN